MLMNVCSMYRLIDVPSIDPRNDNGSMRRNCQSRGFQKSEQNMQEEVDKVGVDKTTVGVNNE